jgi:hypothetical protein
MTVDELKTILNNAINILQDNKAIATPAFLDKVQKVVEDLSGPSGQSENFSDQFNSILADASSVIDIQRNLVPITDNIIGILQGLQTHPIIMALIARFL